MNMRDAAVDTIDKNEKKQHGFRFRIKKEFKT